MQRVSIINLLLAYANRLRFRNLFLLTLGLFVFDLLIPDAIPMIDEIILALLAVLLSSWKREPDREQSGTIIEGEVIKEEDQ